MFKVHKFERGSDCRNMGQSDFEYEHTAVCGYVRKNVTKDDSKVTCFYCKKQMNKRQEI